MAQVYDEGQKQYKQLLELHGIPKRGYNVPCAMMQKWFLTFHVI